jgi:predicted permease
MMLRARLQSLFSRSQMESDMAAELRAHLEACVEDLTAGGMPRAEAERRARLDFGAIEAVKEECREACGLRWSDELVRNVRFALRVLRKKPAFTAAALVTLALSIGANTAVFSIVDALLLRPLPYPQPDRLAMLSLDLQGRGVLGEETSFDGNGWFIIRDHATSVDAAVFSGMPVGANFAVNGKPEYVTEQRVSAELFPVLGVRPLAGRTFSREEDRTGGPSVAVLSYGFWRRVFNGDRTVIGRTVVLRGEPFTVAGVMPPDFVTGVPADLWTPLQASTEGEGGGNNYTVIARLKPGVSWAQAQAQLAAVGQDYVRTLHLPKGAQARMTARPFQQATTEGQRTPVLVLWGAVLLVLVIGCVNIAGLLLASGAQRRREFATRMALGGGRGAVLRQLLTESLVLGLAGAALGVAVGYGGLGLLKRTIEENNILPQLSWHVLAASAALALLVSVLFGLAPALEATRGDLRAGLLENARGFSGGQRLWPRRLLVVSEVSLSVVLLIGAGLLLRSFAHLRGLDPGFDPRGVLTAKVSLYDARYRTSAALNKLFDETVARLHREPGVQAAAVGLSLPYERPLNMGFRRLDGRETDRADQWTAASYIYVTPEYFRALRIPLHRGRGFNAADRAGAPPVAIVNRSFARRYFHGQDPVGLHLGGANATRKIVGVVGDVQQRPDWESLGTIQPMPAIYVPAAQLSDAVVFVHIWFPTSWIVRGAGPIGGLTPAITRAVSSMDPLLPFAAFQTMNEVRGASLRGHRTQALLLGIMAGLALLLAAVGIYGLIANSVAVRTRELGIRLAIGATVAQAVRAATLPGIALAAAGTAAGCLLAALSTPVLRHLLYGVTPGDPATFAAIALTLLVVAAISSLLPARRIARLNPADTLRHE